MRAKMPVPKWAAAKAGADPKPGQPRSVRSRRYVLLAHWDPEPQAWTVEVRESKRGSQGSTRNNPSTHRGYIQDKRTPDVRSMAAPEVSGELKIERPVSFFNFGARAPNGRKVGHTD